MFKYFWDNKEANFGPPLKHPTKGGTHISFEIILKYNGKYVALRRDSIPNHESPAKNKLYFCHDLIRYRESAEQCIKRIVKRQAGATIKSYKIVDIDSTIQKKDGQWAIIPHAIVELKNLPKAGTFGNEITEVTIFSKKTIPTDFAWWNKKELQNFLNTFDKV